MGDTRRMGVGMNESALPRTNKQSQTKPPWTPDTAYLLSTMGFPLRFLRVAATPLAATMENKER